MTLLEKLRSQNVGQGTSTTSVLSFLSHLSTGSTRAPNETNVEDRAAGDDRLGGHTASGPSGTPTRGPEQPASKLDDMEVSGGDRPMAIPESTEGGRNVACQENASTRVARHDGDGDDGTCNEDKSSTAIDQGGCYDTFSLHPGESIDAYVLRVQQAARSVYAVGEIGGAANKRKVSGVHNAQRLALTIPNSKARRGKSRIKGSVGGATYQRNTEDVHSAMARFGLSMVGGSESESESDLRVLAQLDDETLGGELVITEGRQGPVVHRWFIDTNPPNDLLEPEEYETTYDVMPVSGNPGVGDVCEEKFLLPTESVIARMGAKSQLRDWLVSNFPPAHTYVEPFGGSFKVLLWKPYRNHIEIINDVDCDLVHFFRYATLAPRLLAKSINAVPTHEAIILGMRDALAKRSLKGLERAVSTYISLAASFNGRTGSYASSPFALIDTGIDEKRLIKIAKRLLGTDMRATSFTRIISSANKSLPAESYPPGGVFFYLDPPYWGVTGYATHAGVSTFGWREQEQLAGLCWEIDQMGNKFIQTNSDHDDLLSLYGGFKRPDGSPAFFIERREVYYSVAGAAGSRDEAGEFIISNFPLRKQREQNQRQGGLF